MLNRISLCLILLGCNHVCAIQNDEQTPSENDPSPVIVALIQSNQIPNSDASETNFQYSPNQLNVHNQLDYGQAYSINESPDYAHEVYGQAIQSGYPNLNVFIVTPSNQKTSEPIYRAQSEPQSDRTNVQSSAKPIYTKESSGSDCGDSTKSTDYALPKDEQNNNSILRVMLLNNPSSLDNGGSSQYSTSPQNAQQKYSPAPPNESEDEEKLEYEKPKSRDNLSGQRNHKSNYPSAAPNRKVPPKPAAPMYRSVSQSLSHARTSINPPSQSQQEASMYRTQSMYGSPNHAKYVPQNSHKSKHDRGSYSFKVKSPFGIINKILDKLFEDF